MPNLFTERRVISVMVLLLTFGLVMSSFGLQFADLGGAFSPMFFPRIVLFILLGLATLNFVIDMVTAPSSRPIELWPVLIIAAAFVVYVLILMPLGYFISSICVGMVILLALGLRNPLIVFGVPFMGASALIVLFNHTLKMPLPASPFFWWL